jgi:hypothetical protein
MAFNDFRLAFSTKTFLLKVYAFAYSESALGKFCIIEIKQTL